MFLFALGAIIAAVAYGRRCLRKPPAAPFASGANILLGRVRIGPPNPGSAHGPAPEASALQPAEAFAFTNEVHVAAGAGGPGLARAQRLLAPAPPEPDSGPDPAAAPPTCGRVKKEYGGPRRATENERGRFEPDREEFRTVAEAFTFTNEVHVAAGAVGRGLVRVQPLLAPAPPKPDPEPDPEPDASRHSAEGATADGERILFLREFRHIEELSSEKAGKAFAILGRVTVDVPGVFTVRAARMVLWLHPDADRLALKLIRELRGADAGVPLWAVRAVYAEGGRVPAMFHTEGRAFSCASLYYDFEHHRGVILDASLRLRRATDRTLAPDLVLRAKRFDSKEPGSWTARDVTLFSSNYHRHEVVVQVDRVELKDPGVRDALRDLTRLRARGYRDGKGPTRAELDAVAARLAQAGTAIGPKRMSLYGITGRAYGRPVVRWKKLDARGEDILPLRLEADVGGRGQLGTGARLAVGLRKKPFGWLVGAGYHNGRGPIIDIETELDTGAVRGRSFGVFIHDHGADRGIVPPTRDRFFLQHRYRWEISDTWRLDGEWSDLSDAQWLRTIDEREFKEGKDQETLLYLRRRGRQTYFTLTAKARAIGFADVLEESPRAALHLPVLTLYDGDAFSVQLAGAIEAGNLRHRRGVGFPLPGFRTARVDADPTLSLLIPVGPVRIIPFTELRLTAWENALDGESAGRFAGTAGVRIDLLLSRWHGPVRHVMNLSLEYTDLFEVTETASSLFPLDDVDRLTPFESIAVRWRHRLQREGRNGIEEYLSLELLGVWFPGGERPLGRTGDGLFEADLEWTVRDGLHLSAFSEFDLERGTLDTASITAYWQARPRVRVVSGVRHLEGDSDIWTGSVEFEVDTRWRIVTFSQFDFKNGDGLDQGVLIQRLGKTAVVGVRVSYDPGDNDLSFGLKLDLLEKFLQRKRTRQGWNPRGRIGWK